MNKVPSVEEQGDSEIVWDWKDIPIDFTADRKYGFLFEGRGAFIALLPAGRYRGWLPRWMHPQCEPEDITLDDNRILLIVRD